MDQGVLSDTGFQNNDLAQITLGDFGGSEFISLIKANFIKEPVAQALLCPTSTTTSLDAGRLANRLDLKHGESTPRRKSTDF